jgi:hypothetical protein
MAKARALADARRRRAAGAQGRDPVSALRWLLALLCAAPGGAAAADAPPLFDAHDVLAVELEADWDPIRRDTSAEPTAHPATLRLGGSDAPPIPIRVAASGRSRRTQGLCDLPPLRLDFPKREREGTPFRGIGELKLTTHCKNDPRYEQNLLLEYLVYRSYGALTEQSHRVRLLRVRYREPGRPKPRWERFAFAIEDAKDLAQRLGAERVRESRVDGARLDPVSASRAELFYYMIGMTDFSLVARDGGPCCHNARALRRADGALLVVPYDFDQTGVVHPDYAAPAAGLGLRSVLQRKFRGRCWPPERSEASLALLRAKRPEIRALFQAQPELSAARERRALAYLDGFYEWADDPKRVRETLAADCRDAAR